MKQRKPSSRQAPRGRVARAADELRAIHEAIEFMGENPDDPEVLGHVACGLHSGLPLCCVVFFVKVQLALDDSARASYLRVGRGDEPDYFACPRCLVERSFVKLKPCDCGDRLDAHLRRELEALAKATRRPAKWAETILKKLLRGDPLDAETEAAVARGFAANRAEIVARWGGLAVSKGCQL